MQNNIHDRNTAVKKCKCSPEPKPVSEFYRNSKKLYGDGYDSMCKKCRKEMSDKAHKRKTAQWMDGVIF